MQVVAFVGYCGCSVELSWQSDYQPIPHLTVVLFQLRCDCWQHLPHYSKDIIEDPGAAFLG